MSHRDGRGPFDGATVAGVDPVAATRTLTPPDEDAALEALALAGDPDAPLPVDAVSLWDLDRDDGLLPSWYMPAPAVGAPRLRGWRRLVAWIIVAAFLAIMAAGLCSTYGEIVIA